MSNILFVAVAVLVIAIVALIVVISFSKKEIKSVSSGRAAAYLPPFFADGLSHIEVRHEEMKKILTHLKRHIVGMDYFLHGLLLALLAGGHVLVE